MILYVNGDSHAAAAECVNAHAWAQDDGIYWGLGQRPHPDNERASFGCELANRLNAVLCLEAQAGCANQRILRTTRAWLEQQHHQPQDVFVLIQWSTWERQEWWHDGQWYQVNASGLDHIPHALQDRYRQFVREIDWATATESAHNDIWQLHQVLLSGKIPHLFFNGNSDFGSVHTRHDWRGHYIAPYDAAYTFDSVLRSNGFRTVQPESWHFGPDGHCFWAEYLLQYINANHLTAAK